MGRFRYRMQNILNIKEKLETQAKNDFAAANLELLEEQDKLARMLEHNKQLEEESKTLRLKESLSIKEIKDYAIENNVPIMEDSGIDFLTTFIIKKQIKNILEVGTAIGYSAIMMALTSNDVHITTIERDETRYMEALKNIKKFNLEDRITLIFIDHI